MDRRIRNIIVKQNMKDINITVRAHSGKQINGIVDEAIREFKTKKFDLLNLDFSNKTGWKHIDPIF